LNAEVVSADGNSTTLQVRGLTSGGVYFLSVASDTHSTDNYHLSADLRTSAVTLPHGGSGTLSAATPKAAATLNLAQTAQVHFVLAASGATGTTAQLVVKAQDGTVVALLSTPVGRGRSIDVYLPPGIYRVEIRG